MDKSIVTKYRIKKVLKVFSITLLILFLSIIVFGYIRTIPRDIKVSNLSSSSFTVSWNTRFATNGSVFVIDEKNKLPLGILGIGKKLFNDTRDVRASEIMATYETANKIYEKNSVGIYIDDFVTERSITNRGSYFTHHVEVKGLDPESEYSLMIGDGIFFYNLNIVNNEISINTDNIAENISTPVPAYGRIEDANNEEKTIEELDPVEDAVVYINYFDETTGERSNVFSSSVNENGAWYIDLSTAVDKDGNNFVETYSKQITNIEMELAIDAGPLGKWERRISPETSSPLETLVLNIPGASYGDDIPDVLHRTDMPSDSTFVKGVSALEDGCKQIGFCSCGVRQNNRWENCACDADVMERRGCNGQTDAQAAAQSITPQEAYRETCAGGGVQGSMVYHGTSCLKCDDGRWVPSSGCDTSRGAAIYTPTVTETREDDDSVIKEKEDAPNFSDEALRNRIIVDNCRPETVGRSCKVGDNIGTCFGSAYGSYTCQIGAEPIIDDYSDDKKESKTRTRKVIVKPNVETKTFCTNIDENIAFGFLDSNGNCVKSELTIKDVQGASCRGADLQVQVYDNSTLKTYECKDNELVESSKKIDKCDEGSSCFDKWPTSTCITTEGLLLDCNTVTEEGLFKWEIEEGAQERAAIKVEPVEKGAVCDGDAGCFCSNKVGGYISDGETCPEVLFCRNWGPLGNTDGKKCGMEGNVCSGSKCEPQEKLDPNDPNNGSALIPRVIAQEVEEQKETEYLIDQTSGKILGITPGVYTIMDGDEIYMFTIKEKDITGEKGDILIYIDSNRDGVFTEGTDKKISDFGSTIKINSVSQTFKYNLKAGYNFVTFPFLIDDHTARSAAGLIDMINFQYEDALFSIAKYDGTWKVVGGNGDTYDANDFQLVPGQGYILKAKRNLEISVIGKPVKLDTTTDSAPISLFPGWNLIGTYGSNVKQYTAKSLIQGINSYEPVDFTADNVSRWESDVQRYDGFQVTNENGIDIEYGFDFPINTLQSYFVRILNGRGNWQQEVK